jgi:hypothetical protein
MSETKPEDFETAIWNAWAQLFITTQEANEAIDKYRAGGFAAPAQPQGEPTDPPSSA